MSDDDAVERHIYHEASVSLTLRDRLFVDDLRATGAFVSDADLIRTALVNQARLMGIDVPAKVLTLRGRRDPRARQSA